MNPPTKGHERLVKKVVETAKKIGGDHAVYLSHTHRAPTDPLEWNFKRRVCENAFKGVNISKDESIRNPFIALESFIGKYDRAIFVVGSDQLPEFTQRMLPYGPLWGIDLEIISAGERLAESRGIAGMSSTKMRQYALENNKEKFYEGLAGNLSASLKKLVLSNTQKGMKKPK